MRIYALLTDLTQFKFNSYDPLRKIFCQGGYVIVNNNRETFSSDMIDSMCLSHHVRH